MNETTEIFVSRLEQARYEKGLTQTKLASKVGITKSAMSCYIRRKRIPRGDILVSIARALDVSIDYLVGTSNVKKRQTNAGRIRNMPDEELAESNLCPHMVNWKKGNYDTCIHPNDKDACKKCMLDWLQSEAE